MKFTVLSLGLMAVSSLAAPSSFVKRQASLEDVATTGFATTNGGTSGGKGGKVVKVASLADLEAAVKGDAAAIVVITGPISGNGDNIHIAKSVKNVIIRDVVVRNVVHGDSIAIQKAQNVWVDHVEVSSDRSHDKDYYDGLIDITDAADFVTVSNSYLHDHWKCSLVGHSDKNAAEDKGHLTVTYNNNYWRNINSRAPSIRFGTGHIYNNYFEDVNDGINVRQGAQVVVQNNVWINPMKALYTIDKGFAVASSNDFGNSSNTAPTGTFTKAPYAVPQLLEAKDVKAAVVGIAGATLRF
ncbi:polysaccharide lyase family 1 protein [Bipolaris maydis]|nr:polysaccharide lyase family 1 protein [Bipolaris maydis]KAJ6277799.1 polysaccharide lyase [Bipolaris maydis]